MTEIKKDLRSRKGYLNRNKIPLPTEECIIEIITNDIDGEHINLCQWTPCDQNDDQLPENYLGEVRTIDQKINIGFNVWSENNEEFIFYKIIK